MENEKLIKKLSLFLKEKHISRTEFCDDADIAESTLSNFLRGEPVKDSTILKINNTMNSMSVYHLDFSNPENIEAFLKSIKKKRAEIDAKIKYHEKELIKLTRIKESYDELLDPKQKESFEEIALDLEEATNDSAEEQPVPEDSIPE